MARTVKYTVNFMEAAEEDLHRSADVSNLLFVCHFCNRLLIVGAQRQRTLWWWTWWREGGMTEWLVHHSQWTRAFICMIICLVLAEKPVREPVRHQRSVHEIFLLKGIKQALEDSVYFSALYVGTRLIPLTRQFLFFSVDILKDLVKWCHRKLPCWTLVYLFF